MPPKKKKTKKAQKAPHPEEEYAYHPEQNEFYLRDVKDNLFTATLGPRCGVKRKSYDRTFYSFGTKKLNKQSKNIVAEISAECKNRILTERKAVEAKKSKEKKDDVVKLKTLLSQRQKAREEEDTETDDEIEQQVAPRGKKAAKRRVL